MRTDNVTTELASVTMDGMANIAPSRIVPQWSMGLLALVMVFAMALPAFAMLVGKGWIAISRHV